MRIGVISDTHGHLANTQEAARLLAPHSPELVIHCGDVGNPRIIPSLSHWPVHYVLGNVDDDEAPLRGMIEESEIAGCRIAFLHSDDQALFRRTIDSGAWRLVCYGHTHKAEQHWDGPTLVLNPGAVYRASPHSIAVVELPSLNVKMLEF